MNWKELVIFSENFCSLVYGGMLHKEAVEKSSRILTDKKLKEFGKRLRDNELELTDSSFSSRYITAFYRTILQCGLETGRLPEALEIGGEYLSSMMPLSESLRRCTILSIVSFLVNAAVVYYFRGTVPVLLLTGLIVIFILPNFVYYARYVREGFFANVPFVGTWCKQLALMEFFSCMNICYNSDMHVGKMYEMSAESVSNVYLGRQFAKSFERSETGDSITKTLSSVPFMPRGMSGALAAHEYMGKLEVCFHDFSCELRKLVLAKIEVVKAITVAIVLSIGVCMPLIYVLCALFPRMAFVITLGLGAVSGYVWLGSIQLAYSQFMKRYAEVTIWWDSNKA